tara:strand:- start:81 stop:668 length:588 start_codon:yes stop_codon:yes gene_type:complete
MNQLIENIRFKGKLLDIGGGENCNYRQILKNTNYTSVNIDQKISPDFLVEVNEKIPIKDNSFDKCLMFNVLEHIYDWNFIFYEVKRLLIRNGKVFIIIPFLYPIHAAPNDYLRVTSSYLNKFLENNNFKKIKIYPLSYGPFTNSQIIGYSHKKIKGFHTMICVVLDQLFRFLFPKKFLSYSENNPLFYFIEATVN